MGDYFPCDTLDDYGLDVDLRVVAMDPCGWPCSLFHDSSDGSVHCLNIDTQLGEL